MKKIVSILLLTVFCLCLCACSSSDDAQTESQESNDTIETDTIEADEEEPQNAMPEFSTTDLEGNIVTNEIFSQADLTVVNFWGTYCSPCIAEMPDLAEWEASMPENVQMIGIVVDADTEDSDEVTLARQIVEKTGVKYQNLIATEEFNDMISELIGVPTTYFVDKEGNFAGEEIAGADVDGYKEFVENYLGSLDAE